MRILLAVIAVAACASAAFALRELHAITHVPTPQPATVVERVEPVEQPRTIALSTARGPLPFGGVPTVVEPPVVTDPEPENDVDDSESIPDSVDRCPDEPEDHEGADDDGCPEVERTIEREDGRTIIMKSSIIIY
jgi:hypothetical protein